MNILRALTSTMAEFKNIGIPLRCNDNGGLMVDLSGIPGALIPVTSIEDGSGTITTGGVSQTVFSSFDNRKFLLIQNPSTETEPLFYDFNFPASIDNYSPSLAPGQAALFDVAIPTQAVRVTATTTGHRFFARQGPEDA